MIIIEKDYCRNYSRKLLLQKQQIIGEIIIAKKNLLRKFLFKKQNPDSNGYFSTKNSYFISQIIQKM